MPIVNVQLWPGRTHAQKGGAGQGDHGCGGDHCPYDAGGDLRDY